jgi:hypothetical protein
MTYEKLGPGVGSAQAETLEIVDSDLANTRRRDRRQALCRHLTIAGPRPVYEAMLELDAGVDLDNVLERYGRIPVSIYHRLGASEFGGDR